MFLNPVPNTTDWYTPMTKREGFVVIRLNQVLITGVKMRIIGETNMLENACNKKQAKK